MSYEYDLATDEDALELAEKMRPEDRKELVLLYPDAEIEWLCYEAVMDTEDATKVTHNGKLLCIFGCAESPGGNGVPWLLGTPELDRHMKKLCREASGRIHVWLQKYPLLINHTHVENKRILRWLKWLGAALGEEHTVDSGARFVTFYWKANDV